jgi:hypothetical protein
MEEKKEKERKRRNMCMERCMEGHVMYGEKEEKRREGGLMSMCKK